MSPDARKHIRQCWGCDCDGESHKTRGLPLGAQKYVVDIMANTIEKLTGYRPPTCPWRAMYDPLVGPVIDISRLGREGLGMHAMDDDTPAIVQDALSIYVRARNATKAHDDAEEHKARMAEMKRKTKG